MGRRLAAAVLTLALAAGPGAAQEAFRPEPWLADLDQLRDALSAGYANLDWQAERGMDLPGAYARAQTRIAAARDVYAARRVFDRFLASFADGHLEVRWPTPPASTMPPPAAEPDLCARLGYFDVGDAGAIATRLPGFRHVGRADAHLPAGVVAVAGRKVGVLRIPIFTPSGLPRLCDELLAQAKLTRQSACDDACAARLVEAADTAFVEEMRGQVAALAAERPDVLLIDIADNGGGNDSPLALARLVTARPVRRPPMALVRGAPAAEELAARQVDVKAALGSGPPAQQAALARFDTDLTHAVAAARTACDRRPLWTGAAPGCSGLVDEPVYDGPLPPRTAGQALPDWVQVASPTARFPAVTALWRGPLVVLGDWNSASSSELFAAMVQDAGAAVVVGSRTFGAGCGHVTRAAPVMLANSGGVVSMPDCVRRRADGSNEVVGIQPDVAVGLQMYDSPRQRLELVSAALPAALDLAARRARAPE
ncbi:MAG: hypothetical protein JNL41_19895 [Phenylobacterium sp.]|uniref:S41 family peptidase n=1 Tax=Phenylobacterium sp. TaxID=1871053 RepID=UPI001A4C33B5|nr:S41 family peptidase [Phenylobacterium sp.]MBL8556546.1 hypothetical protein [Phenylobacterium sp.]